MFDELRNKLNVYAKRTGEVASLVGIVMLAVPIALIIAVMIGGLFSNIGVGLITFFIALAVLIVWFKDENKVDPTRPAGDEHDKE